MRAWPRLPFPSSDSLNLGWKVESHNLQGAGRGGIRDYL
jgi:hypothetical protein